MHSNTATEIRLAVPEVDLADPLQVGHQHQDLVDELRRKAQSRMAKHDGAQRRSRVQAWMRRGTSYLLD